jgi:hypothetical protein
MKRGKHRLKRPQRERSYKKLFLIATEGSKTEPQYFDALREFQNAVICTKCIRQGLKSSPNQVLKKINAAVTEHNLQKGDEAWVVIDKDNWSVEQIDKIYQWANKATKRNLALSNPKFEYWLLLHFEEGAGITDGQHCDKRLKKHLPNYDKGIDTSKITLNKIEQAIGRAKQRDNPPCKDWPHDICSTTVYRLVERIMKE